MFQDPTSGAAAPINQPALPDYESGRHMLFGSLSYIQAVIKLLHKLNYAEPNDWSRPLPTGQPNEVMAILTNRVRVD
ncbi:hypothetical protein N836_25180 [Leptolyngbya sp. Heron Island J]|uniref:hypothetical protein n=1 Tax=Leptolyngbya sp. Heron Island J TaxID=1385935 RepID=UPI0003B949B3|nr:hypothetical protein [Leptolyngbya sp. Heron Island J]ESA32611.1 hypothetical protein N836_25180 [Leptolyngbya sp. Heron Island J]